MVSSRLFNQFQPIQWAILLFLVVMIGLGALPAYFKGHVPGDHPIAKTNMKPLETLAQQGLTIDGWEELEQSTLNLGSAPWSHQTFKATGDTPATQNLKSKVAVLFLHPQSEPEGTAAQPQAEWSDFESNLLGNQGGVKLDQWRWLKFKVNDDHPNSAATTNTDQTTAEATEAKPYTVEARFFRAWTPEQTYAIAAWYAWSDGGSYDLDDWFWADLTAQFRRQRQPWAAVVVLVPIETWGDIEPTRDAILALAQTTQQTLSRDVFRSARSVRRQNAE